MIPLVHPSRGHITQFYGARQVDGNPHAGQDYAYSNGAEIFPEVYAAADGVVLFAGDSRGLSWPNIMYLNIDFDRSDAQDSSAGNYTIIAHNDAAGNRVALTGYGHQEEVWVQAGQSVSAGQRIGTVGETGFSAGKHLHFDLVLTPFDVDDAPYYGRVDPNPYFATGTTYNLAGSQLGSTTTSEEDDMFTDADRAVINSANIRAEVAMNEATNAKLAAQAALQSVASLLQTRLPDPANLDGYQPSLAEWIVYGNLKAGGAEQSASALTPEVIAAAVAKASAGVDAQAIADRLTVTVKGS